MNIISGGPWLKIAIKKKVRIVVNWHDNKLYLAAVGRWACI